MLENGRGLPDFEVDHREALDSALAGPEEVTDTSLHDCAVDEWL